MIRRTRKLFVSCDGPNCKGAAFGKAYERFESESADECVNMAREKGWRLTGLKFLDEYGRAYCKECRKKKRPAEGVAR